MHLTLPAISTALITYTSRLGNHFSPKLKSDPLSTPNPAVKSMCAGRKMDGWKETYVNQPLEVVIAPKTLSITLLVTVIVISGLCPHERCESIPFPHN